MRNIVEAYGIDTIQLGPTGSISTIAYEVLENSGDGLTAVKATGVKSRKRTSRYMFSQQFVIADLTGSLKGDIDDAENAVEASVQINLTCSGSANIILPSCTVNKGNRIPVGDEGMGAYVIDVQADGTAEEDIIQYNNLATGL